MHAYGQDEAAGMATNRQTADARTEPALSQIATGDNGQAPSLTCRIQDADVRRRLRCSSHEGCMFKDGREGAAHLTGEQAKWTAEVDGCRRMEWRDRRWSQKTEGNTTLLLEHNGQARAVSVMSGAALLAQRGASGSKRNSAQRRRPAWIELRPCHARSSTVAVCST